jgi:rare lipoprotein A
MLRFIFSGLAATTLVFSGLAPQEAKAASCTQASHYGVGDGYHGLTTANGERFNAYGLSAAHKSLPFGTRVRVTNQANGKSVIVRINDDGPHVYGRSLDLSYGAFSKIASPSQGVASVCYSRV